MRPQLKLWNFIIIIFLEFGILRFCWMDVLTHNREKKMNKSWKHSFRASDSSLNQSTNTYLWIVVIKGKYKESMNDANQKWFPDEAFNLNLVWLFWLICTYLISPRLVQNTFSYLRRLWEWRTLIWSLFCFSSSADNKARKYMMGKNKKEWIFYMEEEMENQT